MSQKNSTSKKPQTRNVVLADGTKIKTNNNIAPNIKKGKVTKHVIPKKKFSTETGKTHDDWEVVDEYDSLEYPPPSTHPLFRKTWADILPNLMARDNFSESHLGLLEAYCRLRVELRHLDDFVMANGHTYRIVTVLGEQRKTYPEVNERVKVLNQLATYSKLLDILPKKDKGKGKPRGEEKSEWS